MERAAMQNSLAHQQTEDRNGSPWITVAEGAAYLKCGKAVLYAAIRAGHCRAAYIAGGRTIRTKREWLDQYVESRTPQEIRR
jgi:excisionase family DNA binding protein